jgi:hypothetical protein
MGTSRGVLLGQTLARGGSVMLNGLDILIERMVTHPDEFVREGKWTEILVAVDKHLTDEERAALKQGFADMARAIFNEAVLKGLANEPADYDMIEIIQQDYDSVMAYPLQRQKALERDKKEQFERQLELEKLNISRQHAMQGMSGISPYNQGLGAGWNMGL